MRGLWSPLVCSLGEAKFSWNSLGGKVFSRRKTLQGTRKHIPTDFGKRNNIIHSKVQYSLVCMGGMFSRFPRERHPWGDPVASLRWSCCILEVILLHPWGDPVANIMMTFMTFPTGPYRPYLKSTGVHTGILHDPYQLGAGYPKKTPTGPSWNITPRHPPITEGES